MATTDRRDFDAVVVGSGAAGGTVAWALTRAGWNVAVLEKGPHYTEADFLHDELVTCRRDFFVPSAADDPNVIVRPDRSPSRSAEGWISTCVGGGTVHMSGFFFRMHAEDFQLRTRHGAVTGASVADWPLALDDMLPFYDEVERTIGVSGNANANPLEQPRPPYPLAPIVHHPSAQLVEAACAKLGVHCFPTPRAILSADYQGRKGCAYCSFCGSYGCEHGAKSSSLVTFMALAAQTGRLELRSRAMVTRITTDRRGRANGAEYLDDKGAIHQARARVVVVAASAVQSARLLLASGLANASGLVGKNLMFSTMSAAYGRFPLPDPHWAPTGKELPFLDRAVQDYYSVPAAGLPHAKAGTLLFMLPHVNPIFQTEKLASLESEDPPLWGAALRRRMREYFVDTRTIEVETFAESLPHDGCDVTLDPEVKDRHGLPVARLRLGVHPASLAASDFLAGKGKEILAAAGATKIGQYLGDRIYLVLQAGTARMGTSPRDSVIARTGQLHDVANLYVADASGFPSAGAAPYTLTIMANALRIASHIADKGRRGNL